MFGVIHSGSRHRHEQYCRWFATLTPEQQAAERERRKFKDEMFALGVITGAILGVLFGLALGMAIVGK